MTDCSSTTPFHHSALAMMVAAALFAPEAAWAVFTPEVSDGQTVIGETIENGTQNISTGGMAVDSTINVYGRQNVYGTASGTTINEEGVQDIYAGGTAHGTIINKGGVQNVDAAGTAINTTINKGGELFLAQGSMATGIIQETGGALAASTDVIASGTNAQGQFSIQDGHAQNVLIENGGRLNVGGGHTATGTSIYEDGMVNIRKGGTATGTTIEGGMQVVDGGRADNTTVRAHGVQLILAGRATGTTLNGGNMANLLGEDSGTVVNEGSLYQLGWSTTGIEDYKNILAPGIADGLTVNAGGRAEIHAGTLTDATVSGGVLDIRSPVWGDDIVIPSGEKVPVFLKGTTTVSDGGTLLAGHGAGLSGAALNVNAGGTVLLNNGRECTTDCRYTTGAVTMAGGEVWLHAPAVTVGQRSATTTLNVASLSGSGTFHLQTDLAGVRGDFLNVTGEANGSFGLYVTDTGESPSADATLKLVQTGGGNAAFALANPGGVVDLGTWEYALMSDGKSGWILSQYAQPEPVDPEPVVPPAPVDPEPVVPPVPVDPVPEPVDPVVPPAPRTITPSAAAVLNMAAAAPLLADAELRPVQDRLAEGRTNLHDRAAWSRVYNTRNDVRTSAGAGFALTQTGMVLGLDTRGATGNNELTLGGFFSYAHADVSFDRGGKGNMDSYASGGYVSWKHDSGLYLDGAVKLSRIENSLRARMSGGSLAGGNYHVNGAQAWLEGGMMLEMGPVAITPYASLSGFAAGGRDYRLSNGMQAKPGSMRSVQGETGVKLSHAFSLKGQTVEPWVQAGVRHEWEDSNAVRINHDGDFKNDLSGTLGSYRAGIEATLAKDVTAQVSMGYAKGTGVESPWQAGAGISWSF